MTEDMMTTLMHLERELREIGWWRENAPEASAFASTEPFCVDTMTFSEWLQWVYIPKMRSFIVLHGRLPDNSGLLPIAQEAWQGRSEDTAPLLILVARLDRLVNSA